MSQSASPRKKSSRASRGGLPAPGTGNARLASAIDCRLAAVEVNFQRISRGLRTHAGLLLPTGQGRGADRASDVVSSIAAMRIGSRHPGGQSCYALAVDEQTITDVRIASEHQSR